MKCDKVKREKKEENSIKVRVNNMDKQYPHSLQLYSIKDKNDLKMTNNFFKLFLLVYYLSSGISNNFIIMECDVIL
jgi:hypothetical protein